MEPLITPAEAKRLDLAADDAPELLMERAGLGVALTAVEMGIGYGDRVIVLAGSGSNGGDGYVAARHLARRGVHVQIRSLGYPRGDGSPARRAAISAIHAGACICPIGEPEDADLLIDALFGIGFHGTLAAGLEPWTRLDAPVLAVDVPSGLDALTGRVEGPAFSADATVTFQAAKLGHVLGEGPERSGELHIVDIGLPEPRPALRLCEEGDAPTPVRTRHAHKWSVGSVAVVCGSPGLTGAGLLAARSALGAGAGSACVVCPGALQSTYASLDPGVMSLGIGTGERFTADDAPNVLEAASRYGVLAIGPGLGTVEGAFVEQLLERWDGPVVLDADGLNALDGPSALTRDPDTVVTPHAGEFARLAGEAATHEAAERLAATTGATVLLKGNPTFVTDGGETWVVASGGPELATIGTGDVLTGMVGAFLAGGMPAPTAARAASYHHGVAGAELAEERTVTATALAEAIANAPRS